MNLGDLTTTTLRLAAMSPHLVAQAVKFTHWHAARHLRGEHEHEPESLMPLSQSEAARAAMEMVMVTRASGDNPKIYQPGMETIFEDLDHPQHILDVALSLAGMVSVVAKDEDLERFGAFIMRHEAEEMS